MNIMALGAGMGREFSQFLVFDPLQSLTRPCFTSCTEDKTPGIAISFPKNQGRFFTNNCLLYADWALRTLVLQRQQGALIPLGTSGGDAASALQFDAFVLSTADDLSGAELDAAFAAEPP